MADLVIRNGKIVEPPQGNQHPDPYPATVTIQGGRIQAILDPHTPIEAKVSLDATGMLIFPGPIDMHFHCKAPSAPEKPSFASETRAAAAGGVTTVFEMPISQPCTSTGQILTARRQLAEREAFVNVGLYGAPGLLDAQEIDNMVAAGAIGFKLFMTSAPPGREEQFHGLIADSLATVARAFELIRPTGLPCVFHAEEQSLVDFYSARAREQIQHDLRRHAASRPAVVEAAAIASLIVLAREFDVPVHIAHVSSAAGVQLIEYAHAIGAPVTAETCPHYLLFTDEILDEVGVFGKINPPMRTADDRAVLRQAVRRGVIDVVTTDHSPSLPEEKEAARECILNAPAGHPGVEALVPVVLTLALEGEISLARAVELISLNPARIFNLYPQKGTMKPGADADLLIYDPTPNTRVDRHRSLSRGAESNRLYDQLPMRGKVHATIVGGKIVFLAGELIGAAGDGHIVRPIRQPEPALVAAP